MPTYGYQCEDCDHEQDEFHPMDGPDYEIRCKKCGSTNMKKQISGPAGYVPGTDTPTRS
jgi:putative FmdB family regulatory protein